MTDEALLAHIGSVHAETRGAYGWPRIWRELRKRGLRVGKQRVQRLMQAHGMEINETDFHIPATTTTTTR
jgi:transposase InsO family protein